MVRAALFRFGAGVALLAGTLSAAPEPLQRDTQTKALIQTQLDMKSVTLTLGSLTVSDAAGIRTFSLGSTNGTKIGATGDKIGFLGATPIVRPASTADLRQSLINLGLYTTGGASPLNLNGGAFTSGALSSTTGTFSGTLGVTGVFTGSSITLSGNETVGGILNVIGASNLSGTTITGTLGVSGATSLAGLTISGSTSGAAFTFSGNGTVGGTFGVTGATTLAAVSATNGTFSGTLGVTGTTTLATVNATNGNFSGTLNVVGDSEFTNGIFGGTLEATGPALFSDEIEVLGIAQLRGGVAVTGATVMQGFTATTGSFSSTLGVTGATTLAGVSATTGTFSSTLGVTGELTGTTSSFASTVRGTVQDKGGAVYHVKSAATPLVGDDSTDNTAAMTSLLAVVKAAGGGIIQFDAGTFNMSNVASVSSAPGITIRGAGKGATIIKSTVAVGTPANSDPTIFLFTGSETVTLENITFDGNNIVTTQPNCSLVATIQTPLQVYNCEFINFKRNCLAVQSTSLDVVGCNFLRTTTEGSYINLAILIYSNISRSGPILIERSVISGAGIEVDADDVKISNNDINGFGYGAGIAVDFGSSNGVVSGNTITGGEGPDVNTFYCRGIEVYGSPMTISNNMVHGNDGGGIVIGGKYCTVNGNVIWDNGTGANLAYGIMNNYQGAVQNGSYSTINGNIVRQISGTHQTYAFGDGGGAGPTHGIRFSGNNFAGNTTGEYFLAANSTDYIFDDPLRFSIAWTPGLVSAGTEVSISTTASGVAVGDFLQYSLSPMPNYGFILHVYCYTANTITAVLYNPTGSPQTLGASTLYLKAEKRPF